MLDSGAEPRGCQGIGHRVFAPVTRAVRHGNGLAADLPNPRNGVLRPPREKTSMPNPRLLVRRTLRVVLPTPIRSEVNGRFDAFALDLSDRGIRIEHREVVRPGLRYELQVYFPGRATPLRLPARAVWSWVHRFEKTGDTPPLVFHSGLEFQELAPEVRGRLAAFLAEMNEAAAQTPSVPDPGLSPGTTSPTH